MSTKFKSRNGTNRDLDVSTYNGNIHLVIEQGVGSSGIMLDRELAPAIALATLEAAYPPADYVLDGSPEAFMAVAAEYLRKASSAIEANTKEAADRAALEADAWTLYTSAFPDANTYPSIERLPESLRDAWIRVALKAREMKGAGDE